MSKRDKDKAERELILARMAEDKAERLQREEQAKLAVQEEAAASSASRSSFAPSSGEATLSIRAEEGALRHTFQSSATLLHVREWLIGEQQRQAALARGATSHVLATNEDIEAVRLGRENFERQTARLREEARAMRLGGTASSTETRLYFVSLHPRAEYLSEEAMATTLAQVRCGHRHRAYEPPHAAPRRGARVDTPCTRV